MIATISLGDYVGIAGLIALTGGQLVLIVQARKNGQIGRRNGQSLEEVHTRMGKVEKQLTLPSSPEKSIAAEFEGISQSLHFLSQLFEEQVRKDKQ